MFKHLTKELYGGVVIHSEMTNAPKCDFAIGNSWFIDARSAGIGIVEIRPGFIQRAVYRLWLARLKHIRQLPGLYARRHGGNELKNLEYLAFTNHRLEHSVLVAVLFVLVGTLREFSENDMKLGILGGLSHDGETPALGDITKGTIANQRGQLDEDGHYHDVFNRDNRRWAEFKKQENLLNGCEQVLVAAIKRGEGLVGTLQNILDTLSYLIIDTRELRRLFNLMSPDERDRHQSYRPIFELVDDGTCTVWQWVTIAMKQDRATRAFSQQATIGDAGLAEMLIELRMRMLDEVYLNAANSSMRAFLTEVAIPYYHATMNPTRRDYVTWTDRQFYSRLGSALNLKWKPMSSPMIVGSVPTVELFHEWSEAASYARRHMQTHLGVIHELALSAKTDTKTRIYHVFKAPPERRPVSFYDANSGAVDRIRGIVDRGDSEPRYAVYLHKLPPGYGLPVGLARAMEMAWEKWDER